MTGKEEAVMDLSSKIEGVTVELLEREEEYFEGFLRSRLSVEDYEVFVSATTDEDRKEILEFFILEGKLCEREWDLVMESVNREYELVIDRETEVFRLSKRVWDYGI